jgi:hypothetical protein
VEIEEHSLKLKPWRFHPVKVSGRSEIKASFQSNSLAANIHDEPNGVGGPSRSNLTSLVESKLFAQEEILSSLSGSGLKEATQESDEVQTDPVKGQQGMPKDVV